MSERIALIEALRDMSMRASLGRLRDDDVSPQQMSDENQADLRVIADVAELIDAAEIVVAYEHVHDHQLARLRAALARIGAA